MARPNPIIPVIAGGAVGNFGRFLDQTLAEIARPVVFAALREAELTPADVQAAFVGNAFGGALTEQESILAQVLLKPLGFAAIPMHTVKNACSSGADAMHLAWSAVAYGQYDCVLVLGAEKLTHPDKRRAFAALATATDHPAVDESRSVFTDVNAARANSYMARHGAEPRHFAQVAVKNRAHASLNPRASVRAPVSIEDVLGDRVIVSPLTRAMCSGIVDGAACAIVMSSTYAARRAVSRTTRIIASALVSGATNGAGNATHRAGKLAYEIASADPRDVDVAEVHDATAPQELLDLEDLMLCGRGEAIRLLEDGATSLGGRLPVNTSGGLICRGHPVGATGVAQIVELHEQLTGRAGPRQVSGAKLGLAQMAGGLLGEDSAVASVHLLSV
jgi:acetyl-CoA acyltransferase